jgi:hypothetical protein
MSSPIYYSLGSSLRLRVGGGGGRECHTPYCYLGVLAYGLYTFALLLGLGPCKLVWAIPTDVLGWALISSPGGGGSDMSKQEPYSISKNLICSSQSTVLLPDPLSFELIDEEP